MGSYVNVKYRGQGKFKELVNNLFSKFPANTLVQVPLSNKKLVPMLEIKYDFNAWAMDLKDGSLKFDLIVNQIEFLSVR
jgi:hypothetical protein